MKGAVLPERRSIRRSYHLDLPQLYEVDPKRKRSGCIRRVEASSASLNASSSFLLLDIDGREAWAYSGREAGVTCRNLALSLAKMHGKGIKENGRINLEYSPFNEMQKVLFCSTIE